MSNQDSKDIEVELERLRAESERLKKGESKGISLKVSEKGRRFGLRTGPIFRYLI